MTTTNATSGPSEDAASREQPVAPTGFGSILFADPRSRSERPPEPDYFGDLHLDQIVTSAVAGRDEYRLAEFYYQPLHTAAEVDYQHEILADLARDPVRDAVDVFAERMRTMRGYLNLVGQLHHPLQKQRWFLEAVNVYCDAARELAQALDDAFVSSRGFSELTAHLAGLVASDSFGSLAGDASDIRDEISRLQYTINIKGAHVHIDRYEDQADLSAEVIQTFERFQQGAVNDYRRRFASHASLNHVEEQVLDRVARLFPEPFARLQEFCATYADAFDEPLLRFDREVQFYLGHLEHIRPLTELGLQLCVPEIVADGVDVGAEGGFDLSLAAKLAADQHVPVTNDFRLQHPERILVVTGPNQGGKTTFARMIGQLHHLAALGLPVPARRARLTLPDRIFTHFEREESIEALRGKFEDELVRIHDILAGATRRSLLVMNESFGSTTLADGRLVGTEIVGQIIAAGSTCVFVSFIDELASIGPATVSMMSTVVPDDPAQRTFRVERKPADGLAFAAALAAKYHLGYDELRERIAR